MNTQVLFNLLGAAFAFFGLAAAMSTGEPGNREKTALTLGAWVLCWIAAAFLFAIAAG